MAAYSARDGVQLLRTGLLAFLVELGVAFKYIADTFQEHEKCNLQVIDYYNVKGLWYALPKNSIYRRVVTVAMFRMREHGIQTRENDLINFKKPVCSGGSGVTYLSIGLGDIKPAFLFLLWGFLAAFVVLLLEIVFDRMMAMHLEWKGRRVVDLAGE